jgi:rhodanese-related sulfurtransferase
LLNYSYYPHIKNSINIPYYNLLNNYSHYLNKNNTYYLYCEEGKQSLEISKRLNEFGYNTKSIKGGLNALK